MKLRLEFSKLGPIKFISHLDTMRLFQRSLQRARVPLLYSQGYHPHPKMSIAIPLSLGMESESETMDIEVEDSYDHKKLKEDLNQSLPKGLRIQAVYKDFDPKSVFARVEEMDYELVFPQEAGLSWEVLEEGLEKMKGAGALPVTRTRKKGKKKIQVQEDIKPLIVKVALDRTRPEITLYGRFKAGEGGNLRPDRFLKALQDFSSQDFDSDLVQIKRLRAYDQEGEEIHG
ncbi:MAG: TIGR03936 family radical SAM-associated protein [Tissierellia bacterium]|nr:TIGR03936 family radical SAM-associated protein [Tissierellia bacterium]